MSDANLATLAMVRESTIGTTPNDGLKQLRFTKESLGFKKETVTSAEIRADRQVSDSIKVFGQPGGSIDFEVSFGLLVPILEMALMANWNIGTVTAGVDIAGANITGSAGDFSDVPLNCIITISGSGEAANNGQFRVVSIASDGSVMTVQGSPFTTEVAATIDVAWKTLTPGNQKQAASLEKRIVIPDENQTDYLSFYRGMMADSLDLTIESKKIVAGSLTFVGMSYDTGTVSGDPQYANGSIAQATAIFSGNPSDGDTINIGASQGGVFYSFETGTLTTANQVKVGATASDTVDNLIAAINGTESDYVGPNTAPNNLVTAVRGSGNSVIVKSRTAGEFGNTIETGDISSAISWSGATLAGGAEPATGYTSADTDPIVNGTNNFGSLTINGVTSSEKMKSIKLKIANNLRGKDACGTEGNFDIGLGRFEVTGNLNAYFRDASFQNASKSHSSISIEFYVENVSGSRLYCFLPCLKFTGEPQIEGINTDVMVDAAFEAVIGNALAQKTVIFDYFDATE